MSKVAVKAESAAGAALRMARVERMLTWCSKHEL